MKHVRFLALAILAFGVAAGQLVAQQSVTVEGTLVDTRCYLSDSKLTMNDHGELKDCGTMCLKGGVPAGLVTKDKKFHVLVAPSMALSRHIGLPIRVNGTLHNGAIMPTKLEVNKGGAWEEVRLGWMM